MIGSVAEGAEAVVHTTAYVAYVISFKTLSSEPGSEMSARSKFHDYQLGFDVPLLISLNLAFHTFVLVSVWLAAFGSGVAAGKEATVTPLFWRGPTSHRVATVFGIPLDFLCANVILNVFSGISFLQALIFLPASIAEAIMQTGPAMSILITSILQPHIRYNRWAWVSVVPIVGGGVLACLRTDGGAQNADPKTKYLLGLFWSMIALLSRCLRIIVVDLVVGRYEDRVKGTLQDELSEDTERERLILGGGDDTSEKQQPTKSAVGGGATTTSSLPDRAPNPQDDVVLRSTTPSAPASPRTLPPALKVLQVMMPINTVIYLLASLLIERGLNDEWAPWQKMKLLMAEPAPANSFVAGGTKGTLLAVLLLIVGTTGFLWLLTEFRLVEHSGSYTVAILANLNRTGAIVAAVLVLGENMTASQVCGVVVVAAGVFLKFTLGEAYFVDVQKELDALSADERAEVDETQISQKVRSNLAFNDLQIPRMVTPTFELNRNISREISKSSTTAKTRKARGPSQAGDVIETSTSGEAQKEASP
ncbi:unnamed protein product [Amoebophrya sp. A120]|nr:unnamed protein product [Amoebophrya sp. A120]|eukprot:GSA120T00003001001.1